MQTLVVPRRPRCAGCRGHLERGLAVQTMNRSNLMNRFAHPECLNLIQRTMELRAVGKELVRFQAQTIVPQAGRSNAKSVTPEHR